MVSALLRLKYLRPGRHCCGCGGGALNLGARIVEVASDHSRQFPGRDRLGQEVEYPQFAGLVHLGLVVFGRADDHTNIVGRRIGLQLLKHREPVYLG